MIKKNTSEKCNSAISPLISHNEYSSKDAFYNNLVKWKKKMSEIHFPGQQPPISNNQ